MTTPDIYGLERGEDMHVQYKSQVQYEEEIANLEKQIERANKLLELAHDALSTMRPPLNYDEHGYAWHLVGHIEKYLTDYVL